MKKLIFLSIIAFITTSCNYNNKNNFNNAHNSDSIDDIIISPPKLKNSILRFDSIFSSYRCIFLDNYFGNNLIGEISNIFFCNNKIYIVDKYISNSLTVYYTDGRYYKKIGGKGQGPGEYIKIESVILNMSLKRIEIFDSEQQKIIYFNLEGEFLSEHETPVNFFEFVYASKLKKYYFYSKFIPNKYGNNRLFMTDDKLNIIKGYLPFNKEMIGAQIISMDNFYINNDSIFFMESYSNKINYLSLDGLIPIKEIIFSENNPPNDILINSERRKHTIISEGDYAYVKKFMINNNYQYFRFPYRKGIIYHYLSYKNRPVNFISIFNEKEKFSFSEVLYIDEINNEVYFEFDLSSLDPDVISQIETDGLLGNYIKNQSNIYQTNPIILICKLKQTGFKKQLL